MHHSRTRSRFTVGAFAVVAMLASLLPITVAQAAPIGFTAASFLGGTSGFAPTTLQWGPDGRLYVGYFDGTIRAFTVVRNGVNDYDVTNTDTINAVKNITNHDDDGTVNTAVDTRLVLGIVVTGSASNPVIYATSSDPRIGAGNEGSDLDLDTNSGTLSRLTWNGSSWDHTLLVRGLPRSEENHGPNGIALSPNGSTLYWAYGGNTNKGGPSFKFAGLPEFAYSAAILSVNLGAITNPPYDLPTLDDPGRSNSGGQDVNDPFGGNDGANQAKITAGSPVQIHASGFRNPYDLVIATVGNHAGKMYVPDNGPNGSWGDVPINEGPQGNCTNQLNVDGLDGTPDSLHLVSQGYYGGHPNPTRGNAANTFHGESPIVAANPIECDYLESDQPESPSLADLPRSSNGIAEYTAGNFDGAMTGDLLLAGYQGRLISRVTLNSAGTAVASMETNFATFQSPARPLDVTTVGPTGQFPGTVWIADINEGIRVMEPNDFDGSGDPCTAADNPALDEDDDGYDNADEIDNNTNPCSAASTPDDNDSDFVSDLNDADDDNDGVADKNDAFAIDAANGLSQGLPFVISWENGEPPPGGIANTGFTGLMTNGTTDYLNQFNENNMVVGGAAGVFTIEQVPPGDAFKAKNKQEYGFQFGVNAPSTDFKVSTRIVNPFSGITPAASQSMGLFIGDGTQDDYLKVVLKGTNSTPDKVNLLYEDNGAVIVKRNKDLVMPGPDYVDLWLVVKPGAGTVQAFAQAFQGSTFGPEIKLGGPITLQPGTLASWVDAAARGLAVGMISTSAGQAPEFPASWDFMHVEPIP